MESLFETISDTTNKNVIFMIDMSGSTTDHVKDNWITVFDYEIKVAKDIIIEKNINGVYLMFWSDRALCQNYQQLITDPNNLSERLPKIGGSTHLEVALANIPKTWLEDPKMSEIFIFTDGEINGNNTKTKALLIDLMDNKNILVNIIAIEPNDKDYTSENCEVGNGIFSLIKKEKLTKKIKCFKLYNAFHIDGFYNFNNPIITDENYIPFGNQVFNKDKTTEFIKYLYDLVKRTRNENELLKISYDLSLTVYHMCKHKSVIVQNGLIRLIANAFENTPIKLKVYDIIKREIDNYRLGEARTFQEYRNNKIKEQKNHN